MGTRRSVGGTASWLKNHREGRDNEDIYDFSGVSLDLSALRKEIYNYSNQLLKNQGGMGPNESTIDHLESDDDEEWYPPSPPVYDVAEKLVEINKVLYDDPFSIVHEPNKLRWKPDPKLVQIRWLNSDNSVSDEGDQEDDLRRAFQRSINDCDSTRHLNLRLAEDVGCNSNSPTMSPTKNSSSLAKMTAFNLKMSSASDSEISEEIENNHELDIVLVSPNVSDDSRHLSSDSMSSPEMPKSAPTKSKPKTKIIINKNGDSHIGHVSQEMYTSQRSNSMIDIKNSNSNTSSAHGRQRARRSSSLTRSTDNVNPKIVLEKASAVKIGSNGNLSVIRDSSNRMSRSALKVHPELPKGRAPCPPVRPLQRKASRNSLSSNSSVSSQTTEESSGTSTNVTTSSMSCSTSSSIRRQIAIHNGAGSSQGSLVDPDAAYNQWKMRKREEKRLKDRRTYLQSQLRRQ